MTQVTVSFELTKAQMEALEFEARVENKTVDEMIAWIVQQTIPSLLDAIETDDEGRQQELMDALVEEEEEEEDIEFKHSA